MEQQIDAKLATENTHIDDSCSIRSKDDIIAYLTTLRENASPEMAVNQRSLQSLVAEWRAHNFFYDLHVFRSRTRDVDLERHQVWYKELFCRLVSFFYWW